MKEYLDMKEYLTEEVFEQPREIQGNKGVSFPALTAVAVIQRASDKYSYKQYLGTRAMQQQEQMAVERGIDESKGDGVSEHNIQDAPRVRRQAYDPYYAPRDYRDVTDDDPHPELKGKVYVKKDDLNHWYLFWIAPLWTIRGFTYQGSRARDIAECKKTKDEQGYTWHHVGDYNPSTNKGTMQLVPTVEHSAWGHYGGAEQAYS